MQRTAKNLAPHRSFPRKVTSRCGGVASAFSIVSNAVYSVTIIPPSAALHEQPEGFLGKPAAGSRSPAASSGRGFQEEALQAVRVAPRMDFKS